jgi:hypothetical protein
MKDSLGTMTKILKDYQLVEGRNAEGQSQMGNEAERHGGGNC